MTDTQATRPIMQALKEDTRALHDAAEQKSFMTDLMAGSLPREVYASALPHLHFVRATIEKRLADLRSTNPAISKCFLPYHEFADLIIEDQKFFGVSPEEPNEGARQFEADINDFEKRDPLSLLGLFYVLEGSNMGAMILRKKVQEMYALEGEEGTASLNPHGNELRPRWMVFVEAMNGLELTNEQRELMVDAAKAAFKNMGTLYEGVYVRN